MKGGGQQQNPPDQSLDLYLFIAFIVVSTIILWYYNHAKIVSIIFYIRIFEGKIMLYLLESFNQFAEFVGKDMAAVEQLTNAISYMQNTPSSNVTPADLMAVSRQFGEALTLPAVLLGIGGVLYIMFFHTYSKFTHTHNMNSLSRQEVANWPQISCVVGKDLVHEDISKGEWRMSEQPLTFAKRYGLVETEVAKGQTIARLNKDKARPVFCAQMGPLWTGLEGLPPYVLALFAIFCACAENDSKGARKLLRQIAASAGTGSLDFGGTRMLLVKHVRSKKVGRAVSPHAYLYTVMASMLELAREDGVLSVSEFLWLKPLDRGLWYMLNNVGRRTAFVEVSAPYAHWLVENRLRRPLKVPVIEEAVEALDKALAEILINPDEGA